MRAEKWSTLYSLDTTPEALQLSASSTPRRENDEHVQLCPNYSYTHTHTDAAMQTHTHTHTMIACLAKKLIFDLHATVALLTTDETLAPFSKPTPPPPPPPISTVLYPRPSCLVPSLISLCICYSELQEASAPFKRGSLENKEENSIWLWQTVLSNCKV